MYTLHAYIATTTLGCGKGYVQFPCSFTYKTCAYTHHYNVYTWISPAPFAEGQNKPAIFICTAVLRRPAIARVGTLGARRKQQSGSDPIHLARRSSSGAPSSSAGRRASRTGTWPARPPGTSWRPAPARRPTRPWRSPSRSPPLPKLFSKNQIKHVRHGTSRAAEGCMHAVCDRAQGDLEQY